MIQGDLASHRAATRRAVRSSQARRSTHARDSKGKNMIRTSIKLLATVLLSAAALGAQPDTYPARPIKVVSPFPAGGATDVLTRILAERMAKTLGQPMIVENLSLIHI